MTDSHRQHSKTHEATGQALPPSARHTTARQVLAGVWRTPSPGRQWSPPLLETPPRTLGCQWPTCNQPPAITGPTPPATPNVYFGGRPGDGGGDVRHPVQASLLQKVNEVNGWFHYCVCTPFSRPNLDTQPLLNSPTSRLFATRLLSSRAEGSSSSQKSKSCLSRVHTQTHLHQRLSLSPSTTARHKASQSLEEASDLTFGADLASRHRLDSAR